MTCQRRSTFSIQCYNLPCEPGAVQPSLAHSCHAIFTLQVPAAISHTLTHPTVQHDHTGELLLIHFIWVRILLAYISRPYFGLEVL